MFCSKSDVSSRKARPSMASNRWLERLQSVRPASTCSPSSTPSLHLIGGWLFFCGGFAESRNGQLVFEPLARDGTRRYDGDFAHQLAVCNAVDFFAGEGAVTQLLAVRLGRGFQAGYFVVGFNTTYAGDGFAAKGEALLFRFGKLEVLAGFEQVGLGLMD